MPLALNTVGVLVEPESWLGSVREMAPGDGDAGESWGSDFSAVSLGPVCVITLGERSSLTLALRFKNAIKWSDATTKSRYFGNREYAGEYFYFNRLAFSYAISL